MAIYRVNAILPPTTGLPRDRVINTFHLAGSISDLPAALGHLEDFYTTTGNLISEAMDRTSNGSYLVAYDLADAEPRSPVAVRPFTLPAADSSTSLPLEVAVCVSYNAATPSGAARGRYRGRIYFGPLIGEWVNMSGSYPRPQSTYVTDLADAAGVLYDELQTAGIPWVVFSRVDNAAREIVGGWVDDEFDTQRRRGRTSSSRNYWP